MSNFIMDLYIFRTIWSMPKYLTDYPGINYMVN